MISSASKDFLKNAFLIFFLLGIVGIAIIQLEINKTKDYAYLEANGKRETATVMRKRSIDQLDFGVRYICYVSFIDDRSYIKKIDSVDLFGDGDKIAFENWKFDTEIIFTDVEVPLEIYDMLGKGDTFSVIYPASSPQKGVKYDKRNCF